MKTDVSAILEDVRAILDEIFGWIKDLLAVFQKEEA